MAHPIAKVSNFSYDTLNKELDLSVNEKQVECLLLAYLDDFWQKGVTLLPPSQGGLSGSLDTLLERRYVFRNVIKEVVGRVVGAFYGKPPNWRFQKDGKLVSEQQQLSEEEQQAETDKLTSIDKALGEFFVRQQVAEELGKAFAFRLAFGRGSWRLYIPVKYKRSATAPAPVSPTDSNLSSSTDVGELKDFIAFETVEDALAAMRVEFVPPQHSRLLDDGGELFSIAKYPIRKDWSTKDTVNVIEFSFVDNEDKTFVGTIEEHQAVGTIEQANLSTPFDLAGLTTLGQFKGAPYVTPALYKNNQLVNLALTCAGFSLVDNGFGEVILTNVELETKKVTAGDGETVEIPKDIKRGGGAIQNFVGVETVDEATGSVRRESPGVNFREPTAVNVFKDGYDLGYTACLQEAGQLYAIITGDAAVSGESRIQALADFVLKASPYKSEVDEQGSWLMTAALLWAAELAGKPMSDYRVVYESKMHVASLSNEEKNTVIAMRKDGAISRETERVLLGVDDPELEREIILREQSASSDEIDYDEMSIRADLGLKLSGLGVDAQTIYKKVLKLSDEEIAEMARRQAEETARLQEEIRLASEANGGAGGNNPPQPPQPNLGAGA